MMPCNYPLFAKFAEHSVIRYGKHANEDRICFGFAQVLAFDEDGTALVPSSRTGGLVRVTKAITIFGQELSFRGFCYVQPLSEPHYYTPHEEDEELDG